MAWNTPGSNNSGGGRPPRQRRSGGNGLDDILDRLRGLFDGQGGGGGGGIGRWVLLVLALWLVFNSFLLVNEQQRAVVLRFGQFARILQPGPHFKLPWPIETAIKVNATEIKTFGTSVPVLTSDENIVQVEINVQYRVSDPEKYVFGSRDANSMLQQAALSTVREQVGRSTLDTVLGARNALAVSAREQLQNSLDAYRTGLVVTELNLPNARPPEEVKPAFDDVNSAQQDKDRLISEAEAYAAQVVPEARGQAARVRTVAEGYKDASVSRAEGDADRFSLLVDQYKNAPEVTRKRLWLETVQQVLSGNRKVVGGDSRQLIYVPMDGKGEGGGQSSSTGTSSAPLLTPEILSPEPNANPSGSVPTSTRGERTTRPTGRPETSR
ncbi:membrane protein [Lysobacter concretionis Ko07 = DSM 16239]|jgi:membrane protease subunit HflK|uniref:Protein HflK n=1 Tax=Lysobacter concretionis Ko07 = DSM 16239 TaxID=1122185 RepID=A0A0A0ENF9_9GAMM|nr:MULTISPECIES: FtsH protease activity modulator HflK [Lysobacter]KGM52516.1 membrane protein [Lysobacter concretionis Ko07 = DSM 16239]QOD91730.1 FtsH protease activity modulator HflK [Lysobacter sp. CW239]